MDNDLNLSEDDLKQPKSRNPAQAWVRYVCNRHSTTILNTDDLTTFNIRSRLTAMDAAGVAVDILGGNRYNIIYEPIDVQIAFCITYSVMRLWPFPKES